MSASEFDSSFVPVPFGVRLRHPVVVALIGLPGAGKSTVAEHLSRRLQVRVVNRDQIRQAMFPQCVYSQPEKRASVYATFLAVEVNATLGESSVVDGMTFSKRADLDKLAALAEKYGLRFVPIWLHLPAAVAEARIRADIEAGVVHPAEDRVPEMVAPILAGFQRPAATVPVVDACLASDQVCAMVEDIVLDRATS